MITKTYLPSYLCDGSYGSNSNDSSDSSDSNDSSDSSDKKYFFINKIDYTKKWQKKTNFSREYFFTKFISIKICFSH